MTTEPMFNDLQRELSLDPATIEEQPVCEENVQAQPSNQARSDRKRRRRQRKFINAFRFWSIMGFTSTLMCSWEIALALSLINGGRAGFIWTYLATAVAMFLVTASVAELASMSPTHGGIYHWAGEFAPRRIRKVCGYVAGWTQTVAWQAGAAALNLLAAQIIQGIIGLWQPQYIQPLWHGTLFTIAFGLLSTLINTAGVKQIPIIELIILLLHFFGILIILVPLWVLAPKKNANNVFQDFDDFGGWQNTGFACIVGQLGSVFAFTRVDGGTHIEKIRHSSRIIPCSMTSTVFINGLLGVLAVFTVAFCIPDLQGFVKPTTIPSADMIVYIFSIATGSKPIATTMSLTLVILLFGASLSISATSARHIFSFAKDEGLPFPNLWREVTRVGSANEGLPFNAFILSLSFTIFIALLYIAYDAALIFSISLFVVFTITGYIIAIGALLGKRLFAEKLPTGRWTLGSFSIPVNLFSVLYLLFIFVMSLYPTSQAHLTLSNANWSALFWVAIIAFVLLIYVVHGRYVFRARNVAGPDRNFNGLPSSRIT